MDFYERLIGRIPDDVEDVRFPHVMGDRVLYVGKQQGRDQLWSISSPLTNLEEFDRRYFHWVTQAKRIVRFDVIDCELTVVAELGERSPMTIVLRGYNDLRSPKARASADPVDRRDVRIYNGAMSAYYAEAHELAYAIHSHDADRPFPVHIVHANMSECGLESCQVLHLSVHQGKVLRLCRSLLDGSFRLYWGEDLVTHGEDVILSPTVHDGQAFCYLPAAGMIHWGRQRIPSSDFAWDEDHPFVPVTDYFRDGVDPGNDLLYPSGSSGRQFLHWGHRLYGAFSRIVRIIGVVQGKPVLLVGDARSVLPHRLVWGQLERSFDDGYVMDAVTYGTTPDLALLVKVSHTRDTGTERFGAWRVHVGDHASRLFQSIFSFVSSDGRLRFGGRRNKNLYIVTYE